MKNVNEAGPGAQLAKLLGIKGALPLQLDQVVSPVVNLDQLSDTTSLVVHNQILVPAGVGNTFIYFAPLVPTLVTRVWMSLGAQRGVVVYLSRGNVGLPFGAVNGTAAYINSPTLEAATNALTGDNTGVAPLGTPFWTGRVQGPNGGPLLVDFSANPIPLGTNLPEFDLLWFQAALDGFYVTVESIQLGTTADSP